MARTEFPATTVLTPAGYVAIQGRVYVRWLSLKGELTPDGDDVASHLEYPLGEQTTVPARSGGGTMQLFRRGMIVARGDGRTFAVYGAIYDEYLALGGPGGSLGAPTSDEESSGYGGRVSHFERADIYWREDFGSRVIRRADRGRYAAGADPFTRSWPGRAAALCKRSVRLVLARRVA
jgi:hypothetical protein